MTTSPVSSADVSPAEPETESADGIPASATLPIQTASITARSMAARIGRGILIALAIAFGFGLGAIVAAFIALSLNWIPFNC